MPDISIVRLPDGRIYNVKDRIARMVENKAATLSYGDTTTIATVAGTNITVGLPSTPSSVVPSAYCETAAGTAAKTASCTQYSLLADSYLHVLIRYANTASDALTLNVNNTGAIPVYINGEASSASNSTLPAGSYIVFYDGTNFYFRTDGKLTADITGEAEQSSLASGLPFGFTDSTSTATAFTATIDGITELRNGVCCIITNTAVASAEGYTIDINSLGPKPVYRVDAVATRTTTAFKLNVMYLLIYNEDRIAGGCWDLANLTDANDYVNYQAYRVRHDAGTYTAFAKFYRYIMLLTKSETQLLPINSLSNNQKTNKALTTESFDPFGDIYIYYATSAVDQGAAIPTSSLYLMRDSFNLRYSFNTGTTLIAHQAVYMVAIPQSDGMAKLAANPITQTLPSTEDGLIYIYLGRAATTANLSLDIKHPIYYYKDGALRQWTNRSNDVYQVRWLDEGGSEYLDKSFDDIESACTGSSYKGSIINTIVDNAGVVTLGYYFINEIDTVNRTVKAVDLSGQSYDFEEDQNNVLVPVQSP